MHFRARETLRLGPLFATFTQRGFSSWGIRIGPYTWNATRRTSTIDTPGPGELAPPARPAPLTHDRSPAAAVEVPGGGASS